MSLTGSFRKTILVALPILVIAVCAVGFLMAPDIFGATRDPVPGTALAELSEAFSRVAEEASPAVVFVSVEKEIRGGYTPFFSPFDMFPEDFFERFFGPGWQAPRMRPPEGRPRLRNQGTGFIISSDGYIVTNAHMVGDTDKVDVKLADGREFTAEVAGADPDTDVALIKVDASGLPALRLGDSDRLRVGEWVLAIGNPFGLSHTVTAGIVSAKGRGGKDVQINYQDFIQTDAAINPGNSGGPLLNLNGEVVGLNTAILSRTGGYMGIGFAIPANVVQFIYNQLREKGSITRGFLGVVIQDLTADLAPWFGMETGKGVLITEVAKGSPAERAGLKAEDVIVEFDNQPVEETSSFRSRVASTMPGKKVPIVVLRKGEQIKRNVEIGSTEGQADVERFFREGVQRPSAGLTQLGLAVQNLTDDLAERLGYKGESGVVISQVEPNSLAAEAGLEPGMLIKEVNRQPIRNTADFRQAVQKSEEGKPVLLLVLKGQYSQFITLRKES